MAAGSPPYDPGWTQNDVTLRPPSPETESLERIAELEKYVMTLRPRISVLEDRMRAVEMDNLAAMEKIGDLEFENRHLTARLEQLDQAKSRWWK